VKTSTVLGGIFVTVGVAIVGSQAVIAANDAASLSAAVVPAAGSESPTTSTTKSTPSSRSTKTTTTSTPTADATKTSTPTASKTTTTKPTPKPTKSSTPTPKPTSTHAAATTTHYTGGVSQTKYGPMQVRISVTSHKITNVVAVKITNRDSKSVQISNRAVPILRSEVLKAQSAHVSNVSGATYTTRGYLSSLQSAINAAGL
jgi:uncharacterized protein with FMN-binding domain